MRRPVVVLMGLPNVGKSAIFGGLTGTWVTASNYPGTTVEYYRGYLRLPDGETVEIHDAPGIYDLEPASPAEEVALRLLEEADVIVNVVDATQLERNLPLTLQLLATGKPMVLVLNFWDEAKHKGIHVDVWSLERELGVPVVPTVAVSGWGIKSLASALHRARRGERGWLERQERWVRVGEIVGRVQRVVHRHHTLLERLQDASLRPITAVPMAALMLYLAYRVVTGVGEGLSEAVITPALEGPYTSFLLHLHRLLAHHPILAQVLIGELQGGRIALEESLGLLSTGVYVAIGVVLPYLVAFYAVLGFLEDFGYLPRVAVLVDRFLHRLGLHGYAIIPLILASGCNVAGVLAARTLESRRQRFIACTLMAVAIPCASQLAMITGLVGRYGGAYLGLVLASLASVALVVGTVLDRLVPGHTPSMLVEIPPYRWPHWKGQLKKLRMRVSYFLRDALPYIFLGILLVNVMYALGFIHWVADVCGPVLERLLGLPPGAVIAMLVGFVRKDVAVAMLEPLRLSAEQYVVGATVLAVYFPCAATVAMLLRELGFLATLAAAVVMFVAASASGSLLNLLLRILPHPWLAAVAMLAVATFISSSLKRGGRNEGA